MKQKGFAGVIILILVALAAAGYFGYKYFRGDFFRLTERGGPTAPTASATTGKFCGGIAGTACSKGYTCKYDGDYPDTSGTCIKNPSNVTYKCPANGWANCEPNGSGVPNPECSPDAMAWYKANCPNFQGGGL